MDPLHQPIREQIRRLIQTQFLAGRDPGELKDDVSLEGSHIVDSVRALEIILFIEETFGFTVENDEALPENFDTVNAITAYVARKQGSAA